jgi:hypothetical protein
VEVGVSVGGLSKVYFPRFGSWIASDECRLDYESFVVASRGDGVVKVWDETVGRWVWAWAWAWAWLVLDPFLEEVADPAPRWVGGGRVGRVGRVVNGGCSSCCRYN